MKPKRRRRPPADKVREAAVGGGFYSRIHPTPPKEKCVSCGRPIYSFQRDGKCLRCVYTATEEIPAASSEGPF